MPFAQGLGAGEPTAPAGEGGGSGGSGGNSFELSNAAAMQVLPVAVPSPYNVLTPFDVTDESNFMSTSQFPAGPMFGQYWLPAAEVPGLL